MIVNAPDTTEQQLARPSAAMVRAEQCQPSV